MNHIQKSQEYFINGKTQSSYVQYTLEEIKKLIFTQLLAEHDVQLNKIEHNVNIKENTYNSIYIKIYNTIKFPMCLSTMPTSKWHPKVRTPATLGPHNFVCRPPIGMRSKAKL
jgi:hypothetical protein